MRDAPRATSITRLHGPPPMIPLRVKEENVSLMAKKSTGWRMRLMMAVCAGGWLLGLAQASSTRLVAENTPDNPVVIQEVNDSVTNVIEYWTPKRMASALSADLPSLGWREATPTRPGQGSL